MVYNISLIQELLEVVLIIKFYLSSCFKFQFYCILAKGTNLPDFLMWQSVLNKAYSNVVKSFRKWSEILVTLWEGVGTRRKSYSLYPVLETCHGPSQSCVLYYTTWRPVFNSPLYSQPLVQWVTGVQYILDQWEKKDS